MKLINRIFRFIAEPKKAFEQEANTPFSDAVKYVAILGALNLLLSAVTSAISLKAQASILTAFGFDQVAEILLKNSASLTSSLIMTPLTYLGMGVMLLMVILWYHIFIYIFGGRQGIKNTAKVILYGYTPVMVFSWLPLIGMFAGIWSYALYVLGFIKLQKMKTSRAVFAVILAIIVPIILIAILAFLLIAGLIFVLASA